MTAAQEAVYDALAEVGALPDGLLNHMIDAQRRAVHDAVVRTWERKDIQAAELISSTCDDIPAEAIEEEENSVARRAKLHKHWTGSGFTLRFTKLQELWNTSLASSDDSLETYISNIRIKAKELKRMGNPIADWILVSILLNGLDGNFVPFTYFFPIADRRSARL